MGTKVVEMDTRNNSNLNWKRDYCSSFSFVFWQNSNNSASISHFLGKCLSQALLSGKSCWRHHLKIAPIDGPNRMSRPCGSKKFLTSSLQEGILTDWSCKAWINRVCSLYTKEKCVPGSRLLISPVSRSRLIKNKFKLNYARWTDNISWMETPLSGPRPTYKRQKNSKHQARLLFAFLSVFFLWSE